MVGNCVMVDFVSCKSHLKTLPIDTSDKKTQRKLIEWFFIFKQQDIVPFCVDLAKFQSRYHSTFFLFSLWFTPLIGLFFFLISNQFINRCWPRLVLVGDSYWCRNRNEFTYLVFFLFPSSYLFFQNLILLETVLNGLSVVVHVKIFDENKYIVNSKV